MNVLFVTSEVAGLAKTGGLADVSAALPAYLHAAGHDIRTFMPFYGSIKTDGLALTTVVRELEIRLGAHAYTVSIIVAERPGAAPVYLVSCPVLYHRASLYTADPDEHLRFLVLQRAALDACQRLQFSVDIMHCNDWQASLVPLLVRTRYTWDRLFARAKSLLTIHNLNYQGGFASSIVPDTGLADSAHLFHQDQLNAGRVSFLLHGILYADGVSTVSPTYAAEIQTAEHGAGLDGMLRSRTSTVVGILNGVDYDEWSPERDAFIPHRYSAQDLTGKALDKKALAETMHLPYHANVPIIGIVSRLAGQKGFTLLESTLPALLRAHGFQLVVLGSGERRFETLFAELAQAFPAQVGFHRGFSNELAHLIEAGSDMFLMPSVYEPCGLNQMYSLRYGTVPIVHKTGGLADTVQLWDPATRTGNGIAFDRHDPAGVTWAIESALRLYREPATWQQLIANGMRSDFSWQRQGRLYEVLYTRLQDGG